MTKAKIKVWDEYQITSKMTHKEKIVKVIEKLSCCTLDAVAAELDIKRATASGRFSELCDEGVIYEAYDMNHKSYYRLTPKRFISTVRRVREIRRKIKVLSATLSIEWGGTLDTFPLVRAKRELDRKLRNYKLNLINAFEKEGLNAENI